MVVQSRRDYLITIASPGILVLAVALILLSEGGTFFSVCKVHKPKFCGPCLLLFHPPIVLLGVRCAAW